MPEPNHYVDIGIALLGEFERFKRKGHFSDESVVAVWIGGGRWS